MHPRHLLFPSNGIPLPLAIPTPTLALDKTRRTGNQGHGAFSWDCYPIKPVSGLARAGKNSMAYPISQRMWVRHGKIKAVVRQPLEQYGLGSRGSETAFLMVTMFQAF